MNYPTFYTKPDIKSPICRLPTGISMYFTFIKMVIIYLCVRLLIFDITTMILSMGGNYCSDLFEKGQRTDLCNGGISGYNLKSPSN